MSRFLVVTWDGAGNLTPALGVAKGLTTRGHDVRLLGHRAIHERCGDHGWRFRPFTHTAELDSSVAFATEDEESDFVVQELMMSSALARDVADEIERDPVDAHRPAHRSLVVYASNRVRSQSPRDCCADSR